MGNKSVKRKPLVAHKSKPKPIYENARALYQFEAENSDELSFVTDDIIILKNATVDSQWVEGFNTRTKKDGLVPITFLERSTIDFTQRSYYYDVTKAQAETKLQHVGHESGTFLIRPSMSKSGNLALSVLVKEKNIFIIKHYLISKEDEFYSVNNKTKFITLDKLIDNLSKKNGNTNIQLSKPLSPETPYTPFRDLEVSRENFILLENIGSGNFGVVKKAKWGMKSKSFVAIKMIKQDKMSTEDFINEAKIMHDLNHPNILKLLAICTKPENEATYIVTEYMEKGALLILLREQNKELDEFKKLNCILCDVCEGMKYLERRKYVHCDLRAANILVGSDMIAKVADFGLSKFIDESQNNTKTIFPVRWTAPEAAKYKKFSTKSDVWSFGIFMYEVVTYGDVPYKNFNGQDVRMKVEYEGYRLPNPHGIQTTNGRTCFCPTKIYNMMLSCWEENPVDRFTFEYLSSELDNPEDNRSYYR